MSEKYVLAVDQSTQGTKAILFDHNGDLYAKTALPHKQIVNEQGWVSHDLEEIWQNTCLSIKKVIEENNVSEEDIDCIGITNQRETSCAFDKETGKPLSYAVVWQCARAETIISELIRKNENIEETIRQKTGMNLSAYFPAAKYAWLIRNDDNVKKAYETDTLCLGTIDTYLLYRLTEQKVYATDYSNASRTQLFNIHELDWDEELCEVFDIKKSILPMVHASSYEFGETTLDGYFDTPVKITGMIGDSQAALFGQGCVEEGMVKATYGTGSSVMMNIGTMPNLSSSGLVTSLGWGYQNRVCYVLEGNINYSGAVTTWLKDDLKLIETPQETEAMAFAANPNDITYLVPAFSGLGAPYWLPDARALIYGMSRTTGRNEIVKAALESIAYQITDVIEAMKKDTGQTVSELCADGGSTTNKFLMQFQADILQAAVIISKCRESSAQGAAYMAGLCTGIYVYEALLERTDKSLISAKMSREERDKKYSGWKEAVSKL